MVGEVALAHQAVRLRTVERHATRLLVNRTNEFQDEVQRWEKESAMRLHACFIQHGIKVRSEIVYLCCGFFKFWVFINGICSIKFGHTLPHEIPKSSQTTNLN